MRRFSFTKENGYLLRLLIIVCFFQAIRQLEAEIETTRKAMIANAGTQGSLEKRLLDYRGNLI